MDDIISPKEDIKGELESQPIELKKGRYGSYIKWGEKNIPLPPEYKKDTASLDLDKIMEIAKNYKGKEGREVEAEKEYTLPDGTTAYLVSGRYGYYIKHNGENIALSKEEKENPDTITLESILSHIEENKDKPKVKKVRRSYKK